MVRRSGKTLSGFLRYAWYVDGLVGESYFEAAQEALMRGYRSERPLSDAQLARLPLFSLARATTYLGWVHTRPETETAQEMTPMLISSACELANSYLTQQGDRKG